MSTPLRDLLTTILFDPPARAAFAADPDGFLGGHGWGDLDGADVQAALGALADELPVAQASRLAPALDPDSGDGAWAGSAVDGLQTAIDAVDDGDAFEAGAGEVGLATDAPLADAPAEAPVADLPATDHDPGEGIDVADAAGHQDHDGIAADADLDELGEAGAGEAVVSLASALDEPGDVAFGAGGSEAGVTDADGREPGPPSAADDLDDLDGEPGAGLLHGTSDPGDAPAPGHHGLHEGLEDDQAFHAEDPELPEPDDADDPTTV